MYPEDKGVKEAEGATPNPPPPMLRENCPEGTAAKKVEFILPSEP